MEAMMQGKPKAAAIGAIRALVEPLLEHCGDFEKFREAGLDTLARQGGGLLYDEEKSPAHLEQVYRQILRARARHFRPIENAAQLDHIQRELDLSAAKAGSPLQQGILWLASRLQHAAIEYLNSAPAKEHKAKVLKAVEENRNKLLRRLGDPEKMILDTVETALSAFSRETLGDAVGRFPLFALAGHLLEQVRASARQPPTREGVETEPDVDPALALLLGILSTPVLNAEVNEARLRYARLSEEERNRRYNEFRRSLAKIVSKAAPFAPDGFETFCQAIEGMLYPYPEPLEFIRSYIRAIHANGSQSTIFDDTTTPQSVQQRYMTLKKSRQGNPLVLEIAMAFALRNFRHSDREAKEAFMREVDLNGEFQWPNTMADLRKLIQSPSS